MAEAAPHGHIEAKIKSLVQMTDCSQNTDKVCVDGNRQNKGDSQENHHLDEYLNALGLHDDAVISYQLVSDCQKQPSHHSTSQEDKQVKSHSNSQKKRSARRKRNRGKKIESAQSDGSQRTSDSKRDRNAEAKDKKSDCSKEDDKMATPNSKADGSEAVSTASKISIKTQEKGKESIKNTKIPLPEEQARNQQSSTKQERSATKTVLHGEDFVPAQDAYYKKTVVKEYEKEYIFLLRKKSSKFPTAKFFCRLCDYHCFDVDHCESHKKDSRHKRLMKMRLIDQLLRHLPSPEPAHLQVVSDTIERVYHEQHLTEIHLEERKQLTKKIQQLIMNSYNEEVQLAMYGSSHSTLGLRSSDINMYFINNVPPCYLKDAYLQLKKNQSKKMNCVEDVESDFSAKVPSVKFVMSGGKVRCQLAINGASCHKTADLLYTYSKIDTRLKKLAVAFRYLAKLSKMDKQEEGSLPSYVFYLMTVFFLQQCKPAVLPVLHEIGKSECASHQDQEDWYFKDIDRLNDYWICKNECCVGELWIKMLRFYCIQFDTGNLVISIRQLKPLTRQEKKWTSKKLAIEDPFMTRRNVASCVSHYQVFEYIIDQLKVAYQHFGIPQLKTGPLFANMAGLKEYVKRRKGVRAQHQVPSRNISGDCTENNSSRTDVTRTTKTDTDVLSEQVDNATCSYSSEVSCLDNWIRALVNEIIEAALKQLACEGCSTLLEQRNSSAHEHSNRLGLSPVLHNERQMTGHDHTHSRDYLCTNKNDVYDRADGSGAPSFGQHDTSSDPGNVDDGSDDTSDDPDSNNSNQETRGDREPVTSNRSDSMVTSADEDLFDALENDVGENRMECSDNADMDTDVFRPEQLIFSFDENHLSDSKGPAIMCSICQREGHLKSSCPEENLPPLHPLPPLTRQYKEALNCLIRKVPDDFKLNDWEKTMRQSVVCEVEKEIQETYPGAKLQVFGSSYNGFGFRGSDLDICLTFADKSSLESADPVTIIERLAKVLKKQKTLYNVFPITTAKVPIVKFKHRPLQLEGDISLYNTLAIENTRMLRLYSAIDQRVVYIGYMMKVLAKICNICDASRGSLSSYAYILMVIYFLQQRKPPVLPVLQELIPNCGKKPEKNIDGWNAWFFDNLSQLPTVWPEYGKNKESPADLWLGLLCFYTEQFKFKEYVVSIRQKAPLTKFEKLWNTSTIAIEDPFDLSHNLGAGLSRRMNMFIIRTLRNARKLFGTSICAIPNGYNSLEVYLFDPNLLTDSLPPSDRNCHHCGRIGHFAKECPLMESKKEGEEEKQKQRQKQQRQQQLQKQQQQQQQQRQQQQQQQQQQWQQHNKAVEYVERRKQEVTRPKQVSAPQAKAPVTHVPNSPDYHRQRMGLDSHHSQLTSDNIQPISAPYSSTGLKHQPHSKRGDRYGNPDKRSTRVFVNRNFKNAPSERS